MPYQLLDGGLEQNILHISDSVVSDFPSLGIPPSVSLSLILNDFSETYSRTFLNDNPTNIRRLKASISDKLLPPYYSSPSLSSLSTGSLLISELIYSALTNGWSVSKAKDDSSFASFIDPFAKSLTEKYDLILKSDHDSAAKNLSGKDKLRVDSSKEILKITERLIFQSFFPLHYFTRSNISAYSFFHIVQRDCPDGNLSSIFPLIGYIFNYRGVSFPFDDTIFLNSSAESVVKLRNEAKEYFS